MNSPTRTDVVTRARVCLCRCALPVCALFTCGCGDTGQGTVLVTTWGEAYIEDGLPAEAFPHDGWSVKFSKFLVAYDAFSIADDDGRIVAELAAPLVFDLVQKSEGAPKTLAKFDLEAKAWPNLSYQISPISDRAEAGDGATTADLDLLRANHASMHIQGVATSASGVRKSFDWSFSTATRFEHCHGEQDGREVEGVLVTNGGTQQVELTVHGDHLFYDDLQAESGAPRFQILADSDANADGNVTLAELDAVPLYTIQPAKGSYGTGSLGNVDTLGQYVRTLTRTIGHYRGEGSCESKAVVVE